MVVALFFSIRTAKKIFSEKKRKMDLVLFAREESLEVIYFNALEHYQSPQIEKTVLIYIPNVFKIKLN